MASENPTCGQEHIANELKLKLGIGVSPRTVGKYLSECPRRKPDPSQRRLTFVRNHAKAMVACDFFVVVTARFRIFYVFVLMELSRRTILTVMSRITPARSGPCSNCGKHSPTITRSASSSMIGTASSRGN